MHHPTDVPRLRSLATDPRQLAVIFVLLLASCGGGSDDAQTTTPDPLPPEDEILRWDDTEWDAAQWR